jgi:hypothetical protein
MYLSSLVVSHLPNVPFGEDTGRGIWKAIGVPAGTLKSHYIHSTHEMFRWNTFQTIEASHRPKSRKRKTYFLNSFYKYHFC